MEGVVYFYGYESQLSNLHPTKYTFKWNDAEYRVNCSEQAYVICKALVIDPRAIPLVLSCGYGASVKKVGRYIGNRYATVPIPDLDAKIALWDSLKLNAMQSALEQKFNQVERCRDFLLNTGNSILVEASPTDTYWGAGMSECKMRDGEHMKGLNMMGKTLMTIRDNIR